MNKGRILMMIKLNPELTCYTHCRKRHNLLFYASLIFWTDSNAFGRRV